MVGRESSHSKSIGTRCVRDGHSPGQGLAAGFGPHQDVERDYFHGGREDRGTRHPLTRGNGQPDLRGTGKTSKNPKGQGLGDSFPSLGF